MRARIPMILLFLLGSAVSAARADDAPVAAAGVVELATAAARSWSDDALLVYVENDTRIGAGGRADRWGFLFWSRTRDEARGYSLRDGDVVDARPLGFDFDAPPLAAGWIDSDEALRRADDAGGAEYRDLHSAHLRSMVLTRGLLHLDDPDRTTWTCVYDAEGQPSLWIVVDAGNGEILRRWKG